MSLEEDEDMGLASSGTSHGAIAAASHAVHDVSVDSGEDDDESLEDASEAHHPVVVVLDGANVAMCHGKHEHRSIAAIATAVKFFKVRGGGGGGGGVQLTCSSAVHCTLICCTPTCIDCQAMGHICFAFVPGYWARKKPSDGTRGNALME